MDSKLELERGLAVQKKLPSLQGGGDGKKRVREVDRIIDLPDHIIAQVLSFLRTEEAIRTCVLSSRWRHLWKSITRIYLCGGNSEPDSFANLLEHVVQNFSSRNFEAIDLACPGEISLNRLNAVLGHVLGYKLEKLFIWINTYICEKPEPPLPQLILSCKNLVVLRLQSCFDIQIPESIDCFPCLKLLHIDVVLPDHNDVVNQLLSCCPVLDNLELFCYLDSPEEVKIDISSPTLRILDLWLQCDVCLCVEDYEVIINTPNLECLSIEDDSLNRCVVKDLSGICNVVVNYHVINLSFDPEQINRVLGLLKGIAAAEILTLCCSDVSRISSQLYMANIPVFNDVNYAI